MLEKWRMMHFHTNPSLIHSGNFSDSNIVWIGFVNWSGYKIYEFVKWVKDYVIFSSSDSILWSSEYRLLTAFKNYRVPHLWNLTHIHHIYYQIFHFWLKCQVFLAKSSAIRETGRVECFRLRPWWKWMFVKYSHIDIYIAVSCWASET